MRIVLIALSLIVSTMPAAAQPAVSRVDFLTNYVILGRHAPFFVGVDKGFYREVGLDVQIAPSTGSGFVIAAIEGGQADFGIAEAAPVVQAIAKGAQVRAFGVFMDRSTSGLASLTPHPTPESLQGKTVAASMTDSARVILPIVLDLARVPVDSFTWVNADPSVYFPLLLQGRAELVTASSDSDVPTLERRTGKSIHFASFAEWGYDVFGYFLVARADRIASSPDDVLAFASATAKAVRYAIDNPDEAAAMVVRHHPTLDEEIVLAHWKESIAAIETPYVREHGYGHATEERLKRSIELVQRAFGLDTTLAPDDVFADGFMRR